jgi:tripartite-type tricarboxylate transporter receptor subunit TctC
MNAKLIAAVFYVLFLLSLPAVSPAFAEPYPDPSKTITIICNTPPGGTSDMQIRAIGIHLSKHLKEIRVMVENDSGASGKIAYEKAFKAKPDGYTLLNYNLPSPIITELLEPNVRYKTTDFVPVYAISTLPNALVVNAETWKTVDEFVQEGQKRTVTIGTTGNKTANYLQAVAFANAVKIKVNYVPFKGGAESTQTLAGKHIDAVVTPVLTAVPLVKAGKLRPLIVFSDDPDNTYPGVLLSKDSKWEIASFPLVGAYVAPPNFPSDQVRVLEDAFSKAVKEPSFIEWTKKVNIEITPMNAAKVRAITNDAYRNATKYKSYFDLQ